MYPSLFDICQNQTRTSNTDCQRGSRIILRLETAYLFHNLSDTNLLNLIRRNKPLKTQTQKAKLIIG